MFHRMEGTDTGFNGVELSLDEGRLFFGLIRFWPGNAIAVRSQSPLPVSEWVHVAVSYDGSGTAAGLRIDLNGRAAKLETVRDRLYKDLEVGGGGVSFGERFRSTGLKGGLIDDVRIYDRR